jgi:hypothetical protein
MRLSDFVHRDEGGERLIDPVQLDLKRKGTS